MTISGMRPGEVRALTGQFRGHAERLRSIVASVDLRIGRSSWIGPQSDRFRRITWPRHRGQLLAAADGLDRLAADLHRQVDAQEAVSASSPPGVFQQVSSALGDIPAKLALASIGPVLADPRKYNPQRWTTYVNRLEQATLPGVRLNSVSGALRTIDGVTDAAAGLVLAPAAGLLRPMARAADRFEPTSLRSGWAQQLRAPNNRAAMELLDSVPVAGIGKAFGFVGIASEIEQAGAAYEDGDRVGAAMFAVDATAAVLKSSKNPVAFLAGVGIDAVTDAVEYSPLRGGRRTTKPWNPFSLL